MEALLVLDVVNAIFELPIPLHDPDGFVAHVRGLIDRAHAAHVPVIHFKQLGPEGTRFGPGGRGREIDVRVAPVPGDLVIDKREPDMFMGTELAEVLAGRGVSEPAPDVVFVANRA